MEIMLSKFRTRLEDNSKAPQIEKKAFFRYLEQEIKNGLRCKLEPDGITGMKYIELEFVKDGTKDFFMPSGFNNSEVFYVPSVPSLFSDLRTRIVSILDKLESLDYAGLTNKAEKTLSSADQLLNDPRLTGIIQNLDDSSRNIAVLINNLNQNMSSEQIAGFAGEVNRLIQRVDTLSLTIDEQLREAAIGKTFEDFRMALCVLRNTAFALMETMAKVNAGMESATELINDLDADPSSLIFGKTLPQEKK